MSTSPKTKLRLSNFRRVYEYVRPYNRCFYLAMVLSIVLAAMSPVRGLFIQFTIDKGLKNDSSRIPLWLDHWFDAVSGADAIRFIIFITVLQISILLLETLFRFIFSFSTAALGQRVIKDLRNAVYGKVLKLNLRQYDTTPIGTLTTRTINDIESVNEIFADGLIPIIADLLTIVFVLGTMFWVDWRLTLICLIPFPIMAIATYYFKESVNRSFTVVRNAVARLNAFAQEHLTGMHVVQAFTAEDAEYKKFQKINREHRDANVRAIFAYSVFFPVVEVILAVSLGLLVWWVAGQAVRNPLEVGMVGKITAFILFLNQIFRPLRFIADKFNVIQMGMIASDRIFKLMDNPDEMPEKPDAALKVKKGSGYRIKGLIEFEKVRFAYTPPQDVLKDVSFRVEPGRSLAIVGSTGSGKTTIISLINRLYEHQQGQIRVDGIDIKDYDLDLLRGQIGVVLQDVFLFAGSIADNLSLRNPSISRQKVEDAARAVGLHEFIMRLPGGYDYNVMERGATLSVGQRQLLSFARCLLYDPAILILDEATSSMDTESEMLIQAATEKLMAGRTSIIIAHRLSTIRRANEIMVLKKGEVIEKGDHESLLLTHGAYARLYHLQFEKHGAGV
ncbi:MAG TPA: ABC transporter ATP-binding protein [Phnomibacter sp.]|nr:ABC transporter ATP-binding protein [Phnomibacter sp.]